MGDSRLRFAKYVINIFAQAAMLILQAVLYVKQRFVEDKGFLASRGTTNNVFM